MDNATLIASLPERERLTESEVGLVSALIEGCVEAADLALECSKGEHWTDGGRQNWQRDHEEQTAIASALRKLLALHASLDPAPAAQSTEPETGKEAN